MIALSEPDMEVLRTLAAALTAGLLIGVERGWAYREEKAGGRVSGVRTYALFGLTGGVAGLLPLPMMIVMAAGVAAIIVMGYFRSSSREENVSATGAVVSLLTVGLGLMAAHGFWLHAVAIAAVTTLLLSMRSRLHDLLRGMSETEVEAVARFALIALVILPILPDQDMGPYGAINPRKIWMIVVLVSGLSFSGYVATRWLGPEKGLPITAAAGAMVSSTAVTLSFARKLKEGAAGEGALIAGIAIASLIMFVRVFLLVSALAPYALPTLALVLAPGTIVAIALALRAMLRVRDERKSGEMKLGNPLDFVPALILAAMIAGLSVAVRWAQQSLGDAGMAAMMAVSGLADVDAAVIALSRLPAGDLDARAAGLFLAGPVLVNTAFKGALAFGIAQGRTGFRAAFPLFASVVASGLTLLLMM